MPPGGRGVEWAHERNSHASVRGAVVAVRGLTKSYGGRTVVDHLDLDVHPGEVVGLIGANGAGKTTAVEILQGLRRPDAGQVRVLGLDPVKDADRLRPQIGSQLQDSAARPAAGLGGRRPVRRSAASDGDRLLEQFGLAHRRRSPFAGMSGGERQRLFLVLALLNRPRLVILDELTQGLDPPPGARSGRRSPSCATRGPRSCSSPTSWTRPRRCATGSWPCATGGCWTRARPPELVARHAGEVTVRFGRSPVADVAATAESLQAINRLPGVPDANRERDQVAVRGRREVIAHVGAWLVGSVAPIPPDLRVDIPDLEQALLTLLDQPTPTRAESHHDHHRLPHRPTPAGRRRARRNARRLPVGDPTPAHHRAPAAHPRPAHADVRAGVPDRLHADHRRVVRDRAQTRPSR